MSPKYTCCHAGAGKTGLQIVGSSQDCERGDGGRSVYIYTHHLPTTVLHLLPPTDLPHHDNLPPHHILLLPLHLFQPSLHHLLLVHPINWHLQLVTEQGMLGHLVT